MNERSFQPSGDGPPDGRDCGGAADVGRLFHNHVDDIWYECVFEPRRSIFTWAVTPSTESPLDG